MINLNSPLWAKFAPRRVLKHPRMPMALVQEVFNHNYVQNKYKVIERRYFRSGITTRVDSHTVYTFRSHILADAYTSRRLEKFYKNGQTEFDHLKENKNEVADLSFTTLHIYE